MKQQTNDQTVRRHSEARPFRCICGSLIARLVAEGVELKCRRCKRYIIVPLEDKFHEKKESLM